LSLSCAAELGAGTASPCTRSPSPRPRSASLRVQGRARAPQRTLCSLTPCGPGRWICGKSLYAEYGVLKMETAFLGIRIAFPGQVGLANVGALRQGSPVLGSADARGTRAPRGGLGRLRRRGWWPGSRPCPAGDAAAETQCTDPFRRVGMAGGKGAGGGGAVPPPGLTLPPAAAQPPAHPASLAVGF